MDTTHPIAIQEKPLKNFTVLEIKGHINMFTSHELRNILLDCYKQDKGIIIDLSEVAYMDSSGVATLLEGLSWSRKKNKEFILVGLGLNIYNAFSLNKLSQVFKIRSQVDDTRRTVH